MENRDTTNTTKNNNQAMSYYDVLEKLEDISINLESYNDYPDSASNNAKKAIKYKEENGSSCGTRVGWTRARQLADKKKISRDTIARMASFKRHQQHKDVPYSEGCGGIMWDAWGGSAGINWAISKLKQIDKKKLAKEFVPVNDDYIIIDNRLAFATKEMAEEKAADLGCEGYHEHEVEGKMWFMPCVEHNLKEDDPCQAGYTQYGMKKKNGRLVPNCIPDKK